MATELPKVSAPARRALAAAGHDDLESLTTATEREIAALHGMGPKALNTLREALTEHGLTFTAG